MKIAIWGVGNHGKKVLSQLAKDVNIEVSALIDNDGAKQEQLFLGCTILSPKDFVEQYGKQVDGVLITILSESPYVEIVNFLRNSGIKKIGFVKSSDDFKFSDIIWIDEKKPFLAHVEMHVIDSCNLKCKGCTHFSNLYGECDIYDIEIFTRDLYKLASQVFIFRLWLLGGEPFLNTHLSEYIKAARNILPNADIRLVSNGLLIPNQDRDVFKVIRECGVSIDISGYPPTIAIKDKIIYRLQSEKVSYRFRAEVRRFFAVLGEVGRSNPALSQAHCCDKDCHLLRYGKLYKCPLEGLLYKYKESFGNLKLPDSEGLDIYNSDFIKHLNKLESSVLLCNYCVENPRWFNWSVEPNPQREDWLG